MGAGAGDVCAMKMKPGLGAGVVPGMIVMEVEGWGGWRLYTLDGRIQVRKFPVVV